MAITVGLIGALCGMATTGGRALGSVGASNVLVLYNADGGPTGAGYQIAQYYQQKRPGVHLLGLTGINSIYSGADTSSVSAANYLGVIRPQVLAAIGAIPDSIDVIVTTKGLPLKIDAGTQPAGDTSYNWRRYSSLESELTRVDNIDTVAKMGDQFIWPGIPEGDPYLANNPYYNTNAPFDRADPNDGGIRLAARLDGYSVQTVKATIDRAQRAYVVPLPYGPLVVMDDDPTAGVDQMTNDGVPSGPGPGLKAVLDNWQQAAETKAAQRLGWPSYSFPTPVGQYNNTDGALVTAPAPVIGYVSHGTNDGAGGLDSGYIQNQLQFPLAGGAVFLTHESYNAKSFDPSFSQNQGLIAQWLEIGGTAGLGHVAEPYNGPDNVTNEDLLFQMLLPPGNAPPGSAGLTFVEAAWNATRQLSYVNTVVGDPLMQFRTWYPGNANLDDMVNGLDSATVASYWLQTGKTWREGDFNGDGIVNSLDIAALASYWLAGSTPQGSGALAAVGVPEPASVLLAAVALVGLVGLVRRDGSCLAGGRQVRSAA